MASSPFTAISQSHSDERSSFRIRRDIRSSSTIRHFTKTCSSWQVNGHTEVKSAPVTRCAFRPDIPIQKQGNLAGNTQSKPCAAKSARKRTIHLNKWVKYMFEHPGRDAD